MGLRRGARRLLLRGLRSGSPLLGALAGRRGCSGVPLLLLGRPRSDLFTFRSNVLFGHRRLGRLVFLPLGLPRLLGTLRRRLVGFVRGRGRRLGRAHVQRGLEARDVLAELLDLHRVLELAGGLLEAQREEGLRPLLPLRRLVVLPPLEHTLDLHAHLTAERKVRETKRVLIPILSAAR